MSDKIFIPEHRPREEFANVRATKTGRRYVVAKELLGRESGSKANQGGTEAQG